jgi:hypothetical protein
MPLEVMMMSCRRAQHHLTEARIVPGGCRSSAGKIG